MTDQITIALRLGWAMAEARGRSWPDGPEPPKSSELPQAPMGLLPLRSQRDDGASRGEAVRTVVTQAGLLQLPVADGLDGRLLGDLDEIDAGAWTDLAGQFRAVDAAVQDDLAQRDDRLANAYLLGRGLAECYWGLGPDDQWDDRDSGATLRYLFGDVRRRELTRMLGRLKAPGLHELTPSVISGSLEAWAEVATTPGWTVDQQPYVRDRLYEQARRWYQLLVLTQDPTTMIKPSAQLANRYYLVKTVKAFWLQGVLAVVALALTSTFLLSLNDQLGTFLEAVKPLLATFGLSAFAAAGLLTKGQSAAQRMLARLRQDAYTDLVAVSVTAVPKWPSQVQEKSLPDRDADEKLWQRMSRKVSDAAWLNARDRVEKAVRTRGLTPPTAAPPT